MSAKPSEDNKANRANGAFSHLVFKAMLCLAGLVAVLVMLNVSSGPRLRTVDLDATKLTTQTGQRIVLHANQPLAKIDSSAVRIEPTVPFSVTNTADTVTINLKQRLKYKTSYQLSIKNAGAASGRGKRSDLSHRFTTADPAVFYIKRANIFTSEDKQPDKIMRTSLGGAAEKVVFTAPKIIDYVVTGDRLIVSAAETANSEKNTLQVVNLKSRAVSKLDMPGQGTGTAKQLRASNDGYTIGFSYTNPDHRDAEHRDGYEEILFVRDLRPGYKAVPLNGVSGKTISTDDWQFAPDGTSIIVLQNDNSLLLVDGNNKHQPVPLGRYISIANFSSDGTKFLVDAREGFAVLDLIKRRPTAIKDDSPAADKDILVNILSLQNGPGYLWHYQTSSNKSDTEAGEGGGDLSDYLRYDKDGNAKTSTIVYKTAGLKLGVQSVELSSNGQLAIIETSPDDTSEYDDYPEHSRPLQTKTQLVDLESGKVLKEVTGIRLTVH